MAFSDAGEIIAQSGQEFPQYFPQPGWVEHNADEIFDSVCASLSSVLESLDHHTPCAVGLTNQRETVVLWERESGAPVAPAIVWQDRRTADYCNALKGEGAEADIIARTGLLLDPYFTATKLRWLLQSDPALRHRAEAGELLAGTIDSYIAYRLTGEHITDHSNASRTLLYNVETATWDDTLCTLFSIPQNMLPRIVDSAGALGTVKADAPGAGLPLTGIAGDQQAATIGQACLDPGMAKATYGTGCFLLANTGKALIRSKNRLLSTVLCSLDGVRSFALEGSIFVSGSLIQWMRDGLGLLSDASESEALAKSVTDSGGVVIVPALTGLGAPYWNADARGAIFGLTRGAERAHLVRAALEAQSFQTHDLVQAMAGDGQTIHSLRVDGGMVANTWLCQDLADILAMPIERPSIVETTALGAAILAKYGVGRSDDLAAAATSMTRLENRFDPTRGLQTERESRLARWRDAVSRVDGPALGAL